MSDDEADPELLELLRQSLGLSRSNPDEISTDTGVLNDAEYVYSNAIDVSIDMWSTKSAAASIHKSMQDRAYSTQAWSQQELHPTRDQGFTDVDIVNFIFTMDLLNFSFWSDLPDDQRYQVEYRSKRWSGYQSLLASLRRALDESIPISTPRYWNDDSCSDELLKHVFRSATDEEMPLLQRRIELLRETGRLLHESFGDPERNDEDPVDTELISLSQEPKINTVSDNPRQEPSGTLDESISTPLTEANTAKRDSAPVPSDVGGAQDEISVGQSEVAESTSLVERTLQDSTNDAVSKEIIKPGTPDMSVVRLIEKADISSGKLVDLLVKYFPGFQDETRFEGRRVRFLKRAQIFVADLWAAFNEMSYGKFDDIEHVTMFADYRVPQMLHSLGVLVYSPPLDNAVRALKEIPSGHSWEVQLRGCSIWAVELLRREIVRQHPEATEVNAVLIDFLLYDLAKEKEALGLRQYPHHRTRSIWY